MFEKSKTFRWLLCGVCCLGLTVALLFSVGCVEKKGPMEKAGEKIDDAIEDAGDKLEDATDEASDAIEEAGDSIEDASDGEPSATS